MKKKIISFLLLIVILIPNLVFAENIHELESKTVIYQNNMTEKEIEEEHKRQLEEYIRSLNLEKDEFKITIGNDKIVPFNDPSDYKHEYGPKKIASASGYAGNQSATRGYNFPTGGGFWHSEAGGPTASISVYFPHPFEKVAFNVNLGNKGSSGTYVQAPNTTDYFKLYIIKEYEVQPFIVYKRIWVDDFVGYQWVRWGGGSSNIHITTTAYAKEM